MICRTRVRLHARVFVCVVAVARVIVFSRCGAGFRKASRFTREAKHQKEGPQQHCPQVAVQQLQLMIWREGWVGRQSQHAGGSGEMISRHAPNGRHAMRKVARSSGMRVTSDSRCRSTRGTPIHTDLSTHTAADLRTAKPTRRREWRNEPLRSLERRSAEFGTSWRYSVHAEYRTFAEHRRR